MDEMRQSWGMPGMGIEAPGEKPQMGQAPSAQERPEVVSGETLRKLTVTLQKYKAGKASAERRAIAAENWWKLRNQMERERSTKGLSGFNAKSGWLHNAIVAKHADMMEAYPEPNILPREQGDVQEAQMLGKIVPVILEQNKYATVYSDKMWKKLKTGTGITKVYWDGDKINGMGDIAIETVSLLNVFWEPGVEDIQKSKYFFHTQLQDNESLEELYPRLKGKLKGTGFVASKFLYDDSVTTEGKSTVIDCYYKKREGTQTVLHYVKYVGDQLLYSSENEGKPLYDHGLYPFVFDTMFPIEGSPCGYGLVDLCANDQEQIDILQTAFLKNALAGAIPRYFQRIDGSVNEEEFLDLDNPIIHVSGTLGEDALRPVQYTPLSGNYITMREATINEMRQTSGNTETSNGNTPSGVTAASAIAALQEAAGKGSRDATRTSYRAYGEEVNLVIELVRQFYDLPRQFRITGEMGVDQFVNYDNSGISMQPAGMMNGQTMYRLPVFDIRIDPAKRTAYSRVTQNELALQFYGNGFFAPQQTDQALAALQMMDFDDRDRVARMIARNGTMFQKLAQVQQYALALTKKYEPDKVEQLADAFMGQQSGIPRGAAEQNERARKALGEDSRVTKARAQSRQASQIDG